MHTVTASLSRVGKAGCIIQPNATACSSANQTNVSTHGCTMLSYDAHIAIQGYMHSYSNIKALNGLMLLCWLQLTVLDLSQSSIYGSLPDAWSQLTKVSSVLFKIECLCVNHSLTGQRLCKPGFCKPDTLKDLILDAAVFLFKPAIVLVQASHGVHMLSWASWTISSTICRHVCFFSLVFHVCNDLLHAKRLHSTVACLQSSWHFCLPVHATSSDCCDAVDDLEIGLYPAEWYSSSVLEPAGTGKLAVGKLATGKLAVSGVYYCVRTKYVQMCPWCRQIWHNFSCKSAFCQKYLSYTTYFAQLISTRQLHGLQVDFSRLHFCLYDHQ